MKTYFLDTNVFLQCRPLHELPWGELSGRQEDVLLLIPRGTQKEIDGFKAQGNTRRSQKARDASKLFQKILQHNAPLTIAPRVSVAFPSRRNLSLIPPTEGLDLGRNDDSIVHDALAYKTQHSNEEVSVVGGDTNLLQTANEYGLNFHFLPDDWLLPTESDVKDKRIKELESKVSALTSKVPKVTFSISPSNIKLEWLGVEYLPLTSDQIEELSGLVQEKYPLVKDFSHKSFATSYASLVGYQPPSQQRIEKYWKKYPDWVEAVKKQFASVHDYLTLRDNLHRLQIIVNNSGQVPAESALIQITVSENLRLYDYDAFMDWDLASPPKVPEWTSFLDGLNRPISPLSFTGSNVLDYITGTHRNKNTFYWKDTPDELTNCWERECEEFRHKMEPEKIEVRVLPNFEHKPKQGVLRCAFSAKNLADPIIHSVPIRIKYKTADTFTAAKELLLN